METSNDPSDKISVPTGGRRQTATSTLDPTGSEEQPIPVAWLAEWAGKISAAPARRREWGSDQRVCKMAHNVFAEEKWLKSG